MGVFLLFCEILRTFFSQNISGRLLLSDPSRYYNRSNDQWYYKQTYIWNLGYFVVIFQFIDYQTSWKLIIEAGENIILNIMKEL